MGSARHDKTLLGSLRISTKEYKGTLRYRRSNGSIRSKAYKMLKSSRNFSTTINNRISILE